MEQISTIQPGAGNNMRGKCVVIMQNLVLIRVHVLVVCKQGLNLEPKDKMAWNPCAALQHVYCQTDVSLLCFQLNYVPFSHLQWLFAI